MQTPFQAKPLALFCSLALGASLQVQAQESNSAEVIVVTGSGVEQKIKQAPASISVITRKELESKPFRNLEDAVRHVEGVSVVGPAAGDTDISIRGLPGEYTLILVDGKRQGTRETMNRGTSGVQAYMIPPLHAIERIEVVRGPMSSLYGADAMGGVINIITRKNSKVWQGAISASGIKQADSKHGNTKQGEFWVGGPLVDGLLGLQVYGNLSDRAEDKIYFPNNDTNGALGVRNGSAAVKLIVSPSSTQDLIVEVGNNNLQNQASPGKVLASDDDHSKVEHDRKHWSISHRGQWDGISSRLALQQEVAKQSQRINGTEQANKPQISNTVLDALFSLPLSGHSLKFGGQYSQNKLSKIAGESPVAGYPAGPSGASTHASAVFAEDEIALGKAFTLTAGLRLDNENRYGKHWSPRLYGVYQISPNLTLRGGAGKGFKSPTLRQTESGYCMTTGKRNGSLCGNPKLKPEESLSEEVGIRYDGSQGRNWSLAVFNNQFKNKVVSYNTGVVDKLNPKLSVYVYDNVSEVNLRGLELAANWPISQELRASGNYTYTRSRRQGGAEPSFDGSSLEGRPLDKTPTHVLNGKLDWALSDAFSSYVRANYLGKQYWAAFRNGAMKERSRPASATFDLGMAYAFNKQVSLSASVLNMSDKQLAVDERGRTQGLDGNWLVDEGRRYWVNVGVKF